MRILYCALDQRVPGTTGGATHVRAVAEGLARLGHHVRVLTGRGDGPFPVDPCHADHLDWIALPSPGHRPHLRMARQPAVARLARAWRPDVILERYHNFGGEGILAAGELDALRVLEVNAPVIDHPGSAKRALDRLLLIEPMRRWREHVCRHADLFVTPQRSILPAFIDDGDVVEIEWGADTDRFAPSAPGIAPYARTADEVVVVFAGAFRAWHGAHLLVDAVAALDPGMRARVHAVFIGDGPELPRVRAAAARHGLQRVTFTGAVPYDQMPAALAASDIGVAPFDVSAHPPLQLAFYWSPLKVFEYLASGRPVVAPRLPRLAALVSDGIEGSLYDAGEAHGLRDALARLVDDAELRQRLGMAARERAVRDYSWQAHCARLASAFAARLATRSPR